MLEIEAKVWLTDKGINPDSILQVLKEICEFVGHKKKHDWYFAKKGETRDLKDIMDEIFRLRDENGVFIVNRKDHVMVDGFESNKETEFIVDNKESFFDFVKGLGYELAFEKGKDAQIFKKGDFLFEFNRVDPLGYFLEIEKVCEGDTCDMQKEKKLLEDAFALFGLSSADFESRRYLQLIEGNS